MSADQALTRAQERKNSKIDTAITAGRVAQLQKNMNVTLKLTSGGSMRLVRDSLARRPPLLQQARRRAGD